MHVMCFSLRVLFSVALDCISQVYQLDVENRDHVAAYGIDKSLEVSGMYIHVQ